MAITKAQYQQRKNSEASKALKKLAEGINRGELEVDWTYLRQGLGGGEWIFRCSLRETDKYGKSTRLSETSD